MAESTNYKHLDPIGVITKTRKVKGIEITAYDITHKENYPKRGRDLSVNFTRCFLPDGEFFKTLKKPKSGEWLAEHPEKDQTFRDFMQGSRMVPNKPKDIIYLLPLVFFEDPVPEDILKLLREFAEIFFGIQVKIMKTKNLKEKVPSRINEYSNSYQVHAGKVIDKVTSLIRKDAFCVAGITMCDLYPRESWNFVFGLANLAGRSGVYSLARYLSNFGKYDTTQYEPECENGEPLLKRACKTMCHEISHMFGLRHCVYFKCIMNGSNHLDESDSRPIFLCPVCLRKLQICCQFDIIDRYRKMEAFWTEHGFMEDSNWLNKRIKLLVEKTD